MATGYEYELTFFKFPIDQHETCFSDQLGNVKAIYYYTENGEVLK